MDADAGGQITVEELARLERICFAIAKRQRHLFKAHPSISIEDLAQTAMVGHTKGRISGALAMHYEYEKRSTYGDGSTSSYNTWVGRGAFGALIDCARSLNAESRRQEGYEGRDVDHYPSFANGMDETLEKIPRRLNRQRGSAAGRIGHPPVAYMNAILYREQHGLSWQAFWLRMMHDPALVRMFGFASCPSLRRMTDAVRRLKAWAKAERRAAD